MEAGPGFDDQDGNSTAGATANGLICDSWLIDLHNDDRVARISGVYSAEASVRSSLATLRFETLVMHDGAIGQPYRGGEIFNSALPPGRGSRASPGAKAIGARAVRAAGPSVGQGGRAP